jgi:sec-independent protein translocase protein TatC
MFNHLLELRKRTIWVVIVFFTFCLLFFFFAPHLFHQLVSPLLQILPTGEPLIATQITTPLFTPIKLAADAAILCTAPFALLQIWYFVSPGLYREERSRFRWAIISSLLLFVVGALFCFYVVLPFMLQLFAHSVPVGVRLMPDITYAVDFITRMLLLFGLCFQVPLVCCLMVSFLLITVEHLKSIRPYVIVAAFTIGMLLTPPDVLSQIMLAVPLCLLYELGILLSLLVTKTPPMTTSADSQK